MFTTSWKLKPKGDQVKAIAQLVDGLENGLSHQTLLGVTGSGKTFTIANVIATSQRPALVIAPNKTLAAQLFQEFRELFPDNAVEYFISYYDYYQPEVYLPGSDTFIAKSSSINQDIDTMRHSATRALMERRDVIIVSSVSCIYGLGDPDLYLRALIRLHRGQVLDQNHLISQLLGIQFRRNDVSLERGTFRVRGDTVDIVPVSEREKAFRIQFLGPQIESITLLDALLGKSEGVLEKCVIYPCSHYLLSPQRIQTILQEMTADLKAEISEFKIQNQWVEAQRLEQRTLRDIEMIRQLGYCQGVENYSRYLDGRSPGYPPTTLLDYFPKDGLVIIDESHITVPQLGAMYRGDRARKETLVRFGFRLQAALDNRPINFEEFMERVGQVIYVSATPGPHELEMSGQDVVQQIIRPTGLVDPEVIVKPALNQVQDLIVEIKATIQKGFRVLVTTLTKKMAEELSLYFEKANIPSRYLHSDIDSMERIDILRDLRRGTFDVLVGINLLREGLDLPEVALVAVLDADKEGFLRSYRSLIQMVGRAARNSEGRVILYAQKETQSIRECLDETNRRRQVQIAFNKQHNITPITIQKNLPEDFRSIYNLDTKVSDNPETKLSSILAEMKDKNILKDPKKIDRYLNTLSKDMHKAASQLEFEKASLLRDKIKVLKGYLLQNLEYEAD